MCCVAQFKNIEVLMENTHSDVLKFPYFKVNYRGLRAIFTIEEPGLINGKLPVDVTLHILEWANKHKAELKDNWEKLEKNQKLNEIELN